MKNNLVYIIIAVLFITWVLGEFVLNIRSNAVNMLVVVALILLVVKFVSGDTRPYRRRGLRP